MFFQKETIYTNCFKIKKEIKNKIKKLPINITNSILDYYNTSQWYVRDRMVPYTMQ